MLVSIGCRHVLLGHSEQRLYFNETYERVNLKLKAAIKPSASRPSSALASSSPSARTARPRRHCATRSAPHYATSRRVKPAALVIASRASYGPSARAAPPLLKSLRTGPQDHPRPDRPRSRSLLTRCQHTHSLRRLRQARQRRQPLLPPGQIDGAPVGGASLDPHLLRQDHPKRNSLAILKQGKAAREPYPRRPFHSLIPFTYSLPPNHPNLLHRPVNKRGLAHRSALVPPAQSHGYHSKSSGDPPSQNIHAPALSSPAASDHPKTVPEHKTSLIGVSIHIHASFGRSRSAIPRQRQSLA